MSFVINKSQIISVFQTNNSNPGPGEYQIQDKNKKQMLAAPFNSSSYKKSLFEVQQNKVGPGKYQQSTLYDNLKKKANNTIQCFNSTVKRFDYGILSPRQINKNKSNNKYNNKYNYQSQKLITYHVRSNSLQCQKQLKQNEYLKTKTDKIRQKIKQKKQFINTLRKNNNQRKVDSINKSNNQNIRIILTNPKNTQTYQNFYVNKNITFKYNNGPGLYQTKSDFNSQSKNTKSIINWSNHKQKRFRNTSLIQKQSIPGPGQYQLQTNNQKQKYKNKLTSSFSYNGIKSFMDQIIYNTKNKMKIQILKQNNIKQNIPGPAHYSPDKFKKQSFYYGQQILGSKVQRFSIQKQKIFNPGPGQYNNSQCKYKYSGIIKEVRSRIFGKNNSLSSYPIQAVPLSQQIKQLQTQIKKSKSKNNQQQGLSCTLKQRCQSKLGSLPQQQRFKNLSIQEQKNKVMPGPGQYYNAANVKQINTNSYTNTFFNHKNKKNKNKTISSVFKSTVPRQPYQQHQFVQRFYEVNQNDIGNKNKKLKQRIESLRKVQIQKPGFDSKAQRFYQNNGINRRTKTTNDEYIDKVNNSHTNKNNEQFYENFRPSVQKTSYKSCFTSKTKRLTYDTNNVNNPGPGSYNNIQTSLQKKTFNSQYRKTNNKHSI